MKIESRGKYPGVKIHLDAEECELLLNIVHGKAKDKDAIHFSSKLGKKIDSLISDHPNLLKERTEEEIAATLMKEFTESKEKLASIKQGKDWKKVKVSIEQ
jgi:hypothetical protein